MTLKSFTTILAIGISLSACSPRATSASDQGAQSAPLIDSAARDGVEMTGNSVTDQSNVQSRQQVHSELRSGTQIFRVGQYQVTWDSSSAVFPANTVINRTPAALLVTFNGQTQSFPAYAKVAFDPNGSEYYVAPGQKRPEFVQGVTPTEIVP